MGQRKKQASDGSRGSYSRGKTAHRQVGAAKEPEKKKTEEQRSRDELNRGRQITAKGVLGANTSEPGSLQKASCAARTGERG